MTTMTRSPTKTHPIELDPSGVPLAEAPPGAVRPGPNEQRPASHERPAGSDEPPAGLARNAILVQVTRVDPRRMSDALVWGLAGGRTILFQVDEVSGRELQAALDAGEEPSAIAEPSQILALEIEPDAPRRSWIHSVGGR